MSDKALARIEKALARLAERQDEICEHITALGARIERRAGGVSRKELLEFLDGFRAGEAFGEVSTAAWVEVCTTDCLRGGLRVVVQREGMHARLLAERIAELGGECKAELPAELREAALKDVGGTEKSDAQKLADFVKRFPDVEAALKPIHDMADRLEDDPETQFLLRTIAQDERSTLEFLGQACELLNAA